jgi:hypothetical protein
MRYIYNFENDDCKFGWCFLIKLLSIGFGIGLIILIIIIW